MKFLYKYCLLLSLQLTVLIAFAQQLTPLKAELTQLSPSNIFPTQPENTFSFSDRSKGLKPATFFTKEKNNGYPIFTAEVFSPSKTHYDIQSIWKSQTPIKKGDVLLARFSIRSIYAKQESGEAVVYFFVQEAKQPFEKSIIVDISAGPEWKTMEFPFIAARDMPAGEAAICFSYAALAQKLEITNLQVLNFEQKTSIAQLPVTKFTYLGREANAAWRKDALERIEAIRTAPLNIQVVDAKGKPLQGVDVHAQLIQSNFIWGSSANEALLANDLPDSKKYKEIFKELFNTAVVENGFKWPRWSAGAERQAETKAAFEWLEQQGFRQRGHNLAWPGFKFAPRIALETAQKDTAAFRKIIEEDIRSKMAYTKGRVIAWDVINELIHERDFLKYLPNDMPEQWFKLAKQLDPNAQLFINEYSMLNSIASPKNIINYIDTIQRLRSSGAPIEAIGVQGHIGRQPRNPAQVLTDLDLFIKTGLPVQITEFDINTPDEELQADYTRDFLIACYSHPAVSGFTIWGFWQNKHWKPEAAMFRSDWSPKPNAAVWREWINKKWKTSIHQQSGKDGKIAERGHLGKYEITVTKNGTTKKLFHQLTKNASPLQIKL